MKKGTQHPTLDCHMLNGETATQIKTTKNGDEFCHKMPLCSAARSNSLHLASLDSEIMISMVPLNTQLFGPSSYLLRVVANQMSSTISPHTYNKPQNTTTSRRYWRIMKTSERHLFHDIKLRLPFLRSRLLFRPPSKDAGSRCKEHME